MKKIILILLAVVLLCMLIACNQDAPEQENFDGISFESATLHYNGETHKLTITGDLPEGATVSYENNSGTEEGTYNAKAVLKKDGFVKELNATLTIVEPTAEQIIEARQNTTQQTKQFFDYQYKLEGELSLLGISGSVNGIYAGQYREDKETGNFTFKRTTSGELLVDGVKYVYGKGNQLITLKMNEDGSVKKVYVETIDEQNETFVHKPIEALINSISKDEIEKITRSSDVPGYKYKADVKFKSSNPSLQALLSAVSNLGTTVSLKGAEIPNLANSIQIYFNYGKNNRIDDFFVSINITIPIKTAAASITLSYEQVGATTPLQLPKDDSFVVDNTEITSIVGELNSALLALKTDDAYSIDATASNDFDPSWKIAATVDNYTARLYKNTIDAQTYFNHSYQYKAHHETDGAELYKYTLGNITGSDAGVYLVSRKGQNVVSPVNGECSADTQFDYLVSMALTNALQVDCIQIITASDKTTYKINLNKQAAVSIQQQILEIINSNDADGVADVNNYFNLEEYIFEEAVVEIVLKNGKLSSIKCNTEVRYVPTDGEYTEYNVTLKNTIELNINNKLNNAQQYTAPTSTGTIVGIGAAKYYIL